MRRRTFAAGALGGSFLSLPGCGSSAGPDLARLFGRLGQATIGTNLSGMEWARPGLRHGTSSMPNVHFTVPRRAEILYLASQGFSRNRLPIQWELLQPMLHDTRANAQARALIGEPGEFHSGYSQYITDVLDAHAAAGARCILDLHNSCRYQDFLFQPDGSVTGLIQAAQPLVRPHTSDPGQVQIRIFALAPGATLTPANFSDFWVRAARRWKDHPGFGGYGLMNEPHDMPAPGQTVASRGGEDLTIWPAYARAAIAAIRAVDPAGLIYVAGNEWSSSMAMPTRNPGFPLVDEHLVYEVHLYLDARSTGHAFDYNTEVAKNFSAGFGRGPIHRSTGVDRLAPSVRWASRHGLRLALTEIGMPIDDPRWQDMYQRTAAYAAGHGLEIYSWMGGSHWPIRNYALNHVPGWHQNKTLEPAVAGPMKAALNIARATLYDDGPGWAAGPVTITVYARGYLRSAVVLHVSAEGGGRLNKRTLTLPAGANSSDSYQFTPDPDRVSTLRYRAPRGEVVPPPRQVFSLADPVAHADTRLDDAAHALLGRYSACKWEMGDGYTDYVLGAPAQDGQPVRAVSDSGFGSSPGNAMEMVNFVNDEGAQSGPMRVPLMRTLEGRRATDHSSPKSFGLACMKSAPMPGVQPHPRNRTPYDLQDEHFAVVALSVPGEGHSGVVFQASNPRERQAAELLLQANLPQARWIDAEGAEVVLAGTQPLQPMAPVVLSLVSGRGEQILRMNSTLLARSTAKLGPGVFNQLMIGWGFQRFLPVEGFGGHVFAVVTGRGRPGDDELEVLERYLGGPFGLERRRRRRS